MKVETIKVVNKDAKNGYMLINKSDFNEKEHKKFSEPKKADKPKKGK